MLLSDVSMFMQQAYNITICIECSLTPVNNQGNLQSKVGVRGQVMISMQYYLPTPK